MFIISNKSNERIIHAIDSLNITEPKLEQNHTMVSKCYGCDNTCADDCRYACNFNCVSENRP